MTARKCAGCGYSFIPDGPEDRFCSGICGGTPSVYSLMFAAQQLARLASRTVVVDRLQAWVPKSGRQVNLGDVEAWIGQARRTTAARSSSATILTRRAAHPASGAPRRTRTTRPHRRRAGPPPPPGAKPEPADPFPDL